MELINILTIILLILVFITLILASIYFIMEYRSKKKKEEVIALLESAGYEVTKVVDALIESIVYKQFNADKEKK